jgi:hypothetical protein
MTRKDYVKIARVLALHMQVATEMGAGERKETIEDLAGDLAYMLKADNPRFDRDKFLAACGVK